MADEFPYKVSFAKPPNYFLSNLANNESKFIFVKWDKYKTPFPTLIVSTEDVYDYINMITDLYTEKARMKASVYGCLSPLEYWNQNQEKIKKMAMERYGNTSPYSLRETIYSNTKEATTYSPAVSKKIYSLLLPKDGGTVFDPFSGWGDRAIGAVSSKKVTKYVGVDCNPELKEGYAEIEKLSDKIQFNLCSIFEFKSEDQYDLVFSSPPFGDYETYNPEDEKQSTHEFTDYRKWFDNFMVQALDIIEKLCKPGGYIALHMGETYRTPTFPHDVIDYLKKKVSLIQKINCAVKSSSGKIKRPVPIYVFQK